MFRAAGSWFMALATDGRKRKLRRPSTPPQRHRTGGFSRSLRMEGLEGRQMLSANVDWIAQIGTSVRDSGTGVSADGLGNVYTAGATQGSLNGTNAGGYDAFVSKRDASGTLLWTRQLGTSGSDAAYDVSADGLGNVYISGVTTGNLGGTNAGGNDAFVAKYDASGTLLWTRQLGTSANEACRGLAADGLGNVYISGATAGNLGGTSAGGDDAFVSKYDASGTLLWTRQLGTSSSDESSGVSADGLGNVYISGYTAGSLGGTNAGASDAFVAKYNASGTLLWTRQLGTSVGDNTSAVANDSVGNVYISGSTQASLGGTSAGGYDAFISKYDASGTLLWTRQFGSSVGDISNGVSTDGMGNVYISGYTQGSLDGTSAGGDDAYVRKYDASGTLLWAKQLGTSGDEASNGVSADGLGNVYIAGYTEGNLGGTNAGLTDAWVAQIREDWIAQLGTSAKDPGAGVSADGLGNVYTAGYTQGSLDGTNAGGYDAFISKRDASGALLWTRQLGTSGVDSAYDVSADGLGNVYISGLTTGNLNGTNAGNEDAFISKYDASGTLLWTKQLGTSGTDISYDVSADGLGNVYISGLTYGSLGGTNAGGGDAFVSKYDASGTLIWTKQLGTSGHDLSNGVSADGLGNVYISGNTAGSLGGTSAGGNDAFVAKYDASGTLLWTKQLGTSGPDGSSDVSADGLGNVYISGLTQGSLGGTNAGGNDAFISKYDASGTLLWTKQLGTSSFDTSNGVSADGMGNVYISGYTQGSLDGTNAGGSDAYVSKYDASGTLLWTKQLGTSSDEASNGVSADGLGNVYIAGYTEGSLGGTNAGLTDAWVARL